MCLCYGYSSSQTRRSRKVKTSETKLKKVSRYIHGMILKTDVLLCTAQRKGRENAQQKGQQQLPLNGGAMFVLSYFYIDSFNNDNVLLL